MTRVLFWNIEKFGKNKIDDPRMQPLKRKRKVAAPVNAPGEAQKSSERFTVIKNVITAMRRIFCSSSRLIPEKARNRYLPPASRALRGQNPS